MYEVIRWISLALLWVAMGVNVWTIIRNVRLHKLLEVEHKYYLTMIVACNEFLDAKLENRDSSES